MDLLRLLAEGRSLMGLKKPRGRFEVTGKRLLPKFEASKNPFRATALPQSKAEERAPQAKPPEVPAPSAIETPAKGKSVFGAAPVVHATSLAPSRRTQPWWRQAVEKCRRAWPIKSRDRQARKAPVQPELSLELVRVVRNDLSDSDGPAGRMRTPEGAAMRTLHRGAGAVRALEKSARDFFHACKF